MRDPLDHGLGENKGASPPLSPGRFLIYRLGKALQRLLGAIMGAYPVISLLIIGLLIYAGYRWAGEFVGGSDPGPKVAEHKEEPPPLSVEQQAREIVARERKAAEARKLEELKQRKLEAEEAEKRAKAAEKARELQRAVELERHRAAVEAGPDQLREEFAKILGRGKRSFDDRAALRKLVEEYYKTLARGPSLRTRVDGTRDDLDEQLRHVRMMPFESGVALILRYLGQASERAIVEAMDALRIERALGKLEQMYAFQGGKDRLPLFPEVPKLSPPVMYTAIDGKKPTTEEMADLHRRDAKWELQDAILGIYKDCEEHYRALYIQHLDNLFQYYVGNFTREVDAIPQDVTYPLYLLTDAATANERLGGALVILWQGMLTQKTRQLVLQMPAVVLGRGCPVDRKSIRLVGSSRIPSPEDLGGFFGRNPAELPKREVGLAMRALKTAYERCRPSLRFFYVSFMRNVAARVAALKDRREAGAADAALLKRLQSKDRRTLYLAVEEAFSAPALSHEVAKVLPEAASRAFYDHCPANRAEDQLEAHRAEQVEHKQLLDELMRGRDRKER